MDLAGAAVDDEAVGLADELERGDPDRQQDVLEGRVAVRRPPCARSPAGRRRCRRGCRMAITSRIIACALREALVDRQLVELAGEAAQIVGRERAHARPGPRARAPRPDGRAGCSPASTSTSSKSRPTCAAGRAPADLGHLHRLAHPAPVDDGVDILGLVVDVAAPADIAGAGAAVEGPVGQVDAVQPARAARLLGRCPRVRTTGP